MTTPSPLPAPSRPELRRSGTDRMLGGVCGGLAEYSGIDAVLWRVGMVGLTVAGLLLERACKVPGVDDDDDATE